MADTPVPPHSAAQTMDIGPGSAVARRLRSFEAGPSVRDERATDPRKNLRCCASNTPSSSKHVVGRGERVAQRIHHESHRIEQQSGSENSRLDIIHRFPIEPH